VSVGAEESLLGKVGRLTVSIPGNGPGEVLLPVRGGSEAFAAWSDEPIPRHARVVVVDELSARSVFVTPVPVLPIPTAGPQPAIRKQRKARQGVHHVVLACTRAQ
jgi:hypothetical protein